MEVVLVDSGGANLGSVRYALQRLGVQARLSASAADILAAGRVILPGVGAAAPAMARLHELGLVEAIRQRRGPLLGICLGMQLLFEDSDEGDVECLGLLPGRVRRLAGAPGLRVPHMGWNALRQRRVDALLAGIDEDAQAYFVHGYAAPVGDFTLATCDHGQLFSAVVRHGNRMGVQFHPERSAAVGARLLRTFIEQDLR